MSIHRYTQYMYSYPHKTAYGPLDDVYVTDYLTHLSGSGHSLYLHLPFCEAKCGYCNLFSVTGQSGEAVDRYLDAVERQLRQYQPLFDSVGCSFSEFTIGGGTPLLLTVSQLQRVFSMVKAYARFDDGAEIIIETAPNQTTGGKLAVLKNAGVTRVSMGIQSFFDEELKTLRRSHRSAKARQSLRLLMDSGFPCVNVDFIYGVPGQTVETFMASVQEAAAYEPDELFLYPLYLKHGAILEKELEHGIVLDEELARRQYQTAAKWLKAHGYRQDSMRRFVKTGGSISPDRIRAGREFSDCGFGNTVALGCGGRSYLGNLHFCTPYTVTREGCLDEIRRYEETEDFCRITHGFRLSEEEQKRRYAIRHLLILPGLSEAIYRETFRAGILDDFPVIREWLEHGFFEERDGWLALTDEGMGLSDWLGPQLISPEVRERMNEWEERYGARNCSVQREFEKL